MKVYTCQLYIIHLWKTKAPKLTTLYASGKSLACFFVCFTLQFKSIKGECKLDLRLKSFRSYPGCSTHANTIFSLPLSLLFGCLTESDSHKKRITLWSQFSPPTFTSDPEMKLISQAPSSSNLTHWAMPPAL